MLLSMSTASANSALPELDSDSASKDVSRAQSGDTRAYERLYREHVGHIYALCLRMTANAAAAEDATQEAFIQAWRKLDKFRGESAFSSWLHRIAVNVVLTQMRKQKREAQGLQIVGEQGLAEPQPSPGAEQDQGVAELESAIAGLPERARQVFVLAAVYGYTHDQVAATLDVAVGTCKAHLHRARQMLAEQLER